MHYRFYALDSDGHIRHALDLECENDADAIDHAEQVDRAGFSGELWRGARIVRRFAARRSGDVKPDSNPMDPLGPKAMP